MKRRIASFTATLGMSLMASSAFSAELTFWSMWNEAEPQAQALREVMDAYTTKNPDTTFNVVWNGRQNQVKIRGALEAGTKIDFMDQDGDQLAAGLIKAGLAEPLDSILPDVSDEFLPGVLDIFAEDGVHSQLPYIHNPVSFWYSKGAFESLGVPVPTTMDELLIACKAAADKNMNLLVTEGNVGNYIVNHFVYPAQRIGGPGTVAKWIGDKTGESWKSDEVRKTLDVTKAMWDAKCFSDDVKGFQYPVGQQTIAFGESVGELVGAWLPTELSQMVPEDFGWGSFAFPAIEGGAGSATELQSALIGIMAFKDSPNKEEVLDFFKFLVSAEGQQIISTTGKVGTVNKDVKWNDAIADGFNLAANATKLVAFNDAIGVTDTEFTTTILVPTYTDFFLGNITEDEFVEKMASSAADFWSKQE